MTKNKIQLPWIIGGIVILLVILLYSQNQNIQIFEIGGCSVVRNCDPWSSCINGNQSRICTDTNNCENTSTQITQYLPCESNDSISCTDWSVCPNSPCTEANCIGGTQTRTCTNSTSSYTEFKSCSSCTPDCNNKCGGVSDGCGGTCNQQCCIPNWQCGNWTFCILGQQTRTCTDSNNCGITIGKPIVNQLCDSEDNTETPKQLFIILILIITGIILFILYIGGKSGSG